MYSIVLYPSKLIHDKHCIIANYTKMIRLVASQCLFSHNKFCIRTDPGIRIRVVEENASPLDVVNDVNGAPDNAFMVLYGIVLYCVVCRAHNNKII